jgi:RNA polymerase sigma factor (sigma-70 family)
MNPPGRAIQAIVCQAAGARGPGGRSMTRAYAARAAPRAAPLRDPPGREPRRAQLPYGDVMALTIPLAASPPTTSPLASDVADIAASLAQPQRFHAVVDRHFDAIAGFLSRRVGPDVAQDLAQETFLAAFRARARFDARFASARPWLLGIATRAIASHRREERRQLELYRRAAGATPPLGPADPHGAPLDPALFAGLRALPRRDRDALLLHVWGELSYEETAAALGVPVGTVRSRLNRARRKLTDHLTGANA